jgi:mannonate dehydratase
VKLGLGLYNHTMTPDNFRFAKQAGATHLVIHTPIFRHGGDPHASPALWTEEDLRGLKAAINAEGLEFEAIENFLPAHWSDVLLDGPRKAEQMADLKGMIRAMGRAGIPVMGYNFSIAGVWGRTYGDWARGGARSIGYVEAEAPPQDPIPHGTVWNTRYNPDAPEGDIGAVTSEQLWSRLEYFLRELVPVAEEAGVRLAAHPDDPPLPTLRNTARLVYKPELYQRLLDIVPSHHNALEFCQGTIAEMVSDEMDVYQAIDTYAAQGKIGYVHFRNVRGKVPNYREVFLDEGDVDMIRALRLYHRHGYDGVLIPDHTPAMTCDAPWHAGMAYALGYMRAAITMIEGGS